MRKIIKHLSFSVITLLFALLLSSCSSTKITSDYDPDVDFKTYKTYSFLPWNKQSDKILSDLDKRRFIAAVSYEMDNIGYTSVPAGGDIAINIFLIIDQKTGTSSYNDYYTSGVGVGYYYGPWGYNYPGGVSTYTTMHSYDYKEGTLILDLLDSKKKQLAWQGTAKAIIDSNPKSVNQGIKTVVSKLFAEFPLNKEKK
ncbi:MAG: hypothetical protein B7C24_13800 [Bacteroidetes bacterium 4572_77]|nr:MAG: hypothetical protein B7C24_13800 [Bacteroidetes bacterium 4572_77]